MPGFFASYHALSSPGRVVSQACGVIHPHALTPPQLAKVPGRTKFGHGHRPIHHQRYSVSCKEVLDAGIVHDTGNRGRRAATPDWAPVLTARAFRRGRRASIERALQ